VQRYTNVSEVPNLRYNTQSQLEASDIPLDSLHQAHPAALLVRLAEGIGKSRIEVYPTLDQIDVDLHAVCTHALHELLDVRVQVLDGAVLNPDGKRPILLRGG
jgi:hypothetical protein